MERHHLGWMVCFQAWNSYLNNFSPKGLWCKEEEWTHQWRRNMNMIPKSTTLTISWRAMFSKMTFHNLLASISWSLARSNFLMVSQRKSSRTWRTTMLLSTFSWKIQIGSLPASTISWAIADMGLAASILIKLKRRLTKKKRAQCTHLMKSAVSAWRKLSHLGDNSVS